MANDTNHINIMEAEAIPKRTPKLTKNSNMTVSDVGVERLV